MVVTVAVKIVYVTILVLIFAMTLVGKILLYIKLILDADQKWKDELRRLMESARLINVNDDKEKELDSNIMMLTNNILHGGTGGKNLTISNLNNNIGKTGDV